MSYFNHPLFQLLETHLPPQQSSLLGDFKRRNDVLGLVSQTVDRSVEVDFTDVFFKELFRKVSDAPLGIDTSKVSIDSFLSVEQENVLTNERIRNLSHFINEQPFSELGILIRRIRKQIDIIMSSVSLESVDPRITFGATMDLKRGNTIFDRFNQPSVTEKCLTFLRSEGEIRSDYASCAYPMEKNSKSPFGALSDDFKIVTGCVVDTVPKTALTDRLITKGETVNLAYQAGVGDKIFEALRNFGLDKRKSEAIHKSLVKQASIDGFLATRDLQSASDRITTELARLLLPSRLFEWLEATRSDFAQVEDTWHKLEMLSPAGNGFTFEVETLVFYSIALISSTDNKIDVYSSAPPFVSVYGDDVILPSIYTERLDKVFSLFGFVVNLKKSFSTGYFRESCGGDFYKGTNVRGYNVKHLPETPEEWISIINAVRRVCYYNNDSKWRGLWCRDLWCALQSAVPEESRLYGPLHYGDSCINTEDESLYRLKRHKRGFRSELIKLRVLAGGTFTSVGKKIHENKTSSDLFLRLSSHVSLQGHGLCDDKENNKVYPYSIRTNNLSSYYVNKWVPFTLFGQAPEDIDELFEKISPNAYRLTDSRQVIARNVYKEHLDRQKLLSAREALINAISRVVILRQERACKDIATFENFLV